jgi:hypothetical protein
MKTTLDLADDLAVKARQLAKKRGVTLRAIVEEALRAKLDAEARQTRYELPNRSVKGKGLQPDFKDKPWSVIREAAYDTDYK